MRETALERTQLAWQRYAFGVAIVALLSLRAGLAGEHDILAFAIAFVLGATAAALQLIGPRLESHAAIRLALAASLFAAAAALVLALL